MIICDIILLINLINFVHGHTISIYDDDLENLNSELLKLNEINAILEWESATQPSANVSVFKKEFYKIRTKWRREWCDKLRGQRGRNSGEERMVDLLCRGPDFSPEQASLISMITDELLGAYESTKLCDDAGECYHGEPELRRLMTTSRDEGVLKWAWISWRNEMSSVKSVFMQFIELENAGARTNGKRLKARTFLNIIM